MPAAGGVPLIESCIDLRGLEPPEPLVRVLEALESDATGPHCFVFSREPLVLYPLLARAGWRHALRCDDRGYVLRVERGMPDP